MKLFKLAGGFFMFLAAQPCMGATEDNLPLVSGVSSSEGTISAPVYYTQLTMTSSVFNVAEPEKKQLGKDILQALGLRKETRSVIVSLAVSSAGISYPEIPILSYQFDGKQKLTDISYIKTKTLPLQRLLPADLYDVVLTYKFSEKIEVDVNKATTDLTALIPSSSLASFITKPFFDGVGKVASSILSLANSQETRFRFADEMSPYAGKNNKLVLTLSRPNGQQLGVVTLSMLGTPTLNRPSKSIASLTSADLAKLSGEDPTILALYVAGTRRLLLTEAKGLNSFAPLTSKRTDTDVQNYCSSARARLDGEFGVTSMDRVSLIYQALTDIGFSTETNNSWYFACFTTDEKATLKTALGLDPTLTVPVVPGTSYNIPRPLKYAFGCFATGLTGSDCTANAPNPRQALTEAFAPLVAIESMEMPDVIDLAALPSNRQIARDALLDGLAGKAGRFGCFPNGLVLTSKDNSKSFMVEVEESGGRLTKIRIRSVPASAIDCI